MVYNVKVAINEVLLLALEDKQKVREWWKKPLEHLGGETPISLWKCGSRGRYKVSILVLKLLDLQKTVLQFSHLK
jgi:hypothetical protein